MENTVGSLITALSSQAESLLEDVIMEGKVPSQGELTEREKEILKRLSAGLTDQQIAADLFLSPNTIRWYNRQIYSKLHVGSRTQAIAHAKEHGLLYNEASTPPSPPPIHNLPMPASSFIGRTHEINEVKQLLSNSRLLTLTGTGGTGKTRLALRVATEVAEDFADGICFVDLAPLTRHALIVNAIAAELKVVENSDEPLLQTLKRVLAPQKKLLLMDNFEHLLHAAPLVSELLEAAPQLKVLTTSRTALRLSGEQEYPIPPLSLPSADAVTIRAITESEAGCLFVQRAQMMQPHFVLTADNVPAIAQICARLDGLPLAIELAAARCKLLTPQMLLQRLDNRLDTLAGGLRDAPARQQTLRNTIEWSFNLLGESEKILFGRLAIFRNGFSLESIEEVCGSGLSIGVLEGLETLVDTSLVQQKEVVHNEPRFTLLETLHEYAWELLESSGEAETIRKRHAEYFVDLTERAEPELLSAQQKHWFGLLETEQENFRAALAWSLGGGDVTLGVRLASALCFYWYAYGHHVEGLHWTQQLLKRLGETPKQDHAKFLIGAAHMMRIRNIATAKPLLMRALSVSRELGDTYHVAFSLIHMAYVMMGEPKALATAEEGLALFQELGYQPGIAQALNTIGEIARFSGDDTRAERAYKECLTLRHQMGDTRGILITFLNLTFIAQHKGDFEQAINSAHKALTLAHQLDLDSEMAECLIGFAGVIGMNGQPHLAARLFGAANAVIERSGTYFDVPDRPEFDRMIAAVRTQLDDATFLAAWEEGEGMSLVQAVSEALHQEG